MSFKISEFEWCERVNAGELLHAVHSHKLVKIKSHPVYSKISLIDFAEQLGDLLEWEFGKVNTLQVDENTSNYLYSREKVPLHWDGAFKKSPSYLIFFCIENNSPESGRTSFVDTTQLVKDMSLPLKEVLKQTILHYKTEKKVHYGGEFKCAPLQKHPITGEAILRFAERVESELNPVYLDIECTQNNKVIDIETELRKAFYQSEYCYYHSWQAGELVVADNHALLHGREALEAISNRHLLRVQVL